MPTEGQMAAYVVASLAVGVAMAWAVELPFLRFRDRKFPSRATPLDVLPQAVKAEPETTAGERPPSGPPA
jgi:hypothetical protein